MIAIYYLHFRRDFIDVAIKLLNGIKEENKSKIKFYIMSQPHNFGLISEKIKTLDPAIAMEIVFLPFRYNNYLDKIKWACEQDHEYSVKYDEDVFLSSKSWDYFIENIPKVLESETIKVLCPTLQNGVPSNDFFLTDFLDANCNSKIFLEIQKKFLNTKITKIGNLICPGYDQDHYSNLNKHTLNSVVWDEDSFYIDVFKIPHVYKGIHPIRINFDAQKLILDWILNNINSFKEGHNKKFTYKVNNYPYLCNTFFAIKTKNWKESINNVVEGFDEVPLNLYLEKYPISTTFIRGLYGIHTLYSNVAEQPDEMNPHSSADGNKTEAEFVEALRKLI